MRILSLLWGFLIGGIGKCLLAYQRLAKQTDFDVHTACIQLDCVGRSDIDLRLIRRPGLMNALVANFITMRECFLAFLAKQSIDMFWLMMSIS